jgi:hypothetical protein
MREHRRESSGNFPQIFRKDSTCENFRKFSITSATVPGTSALLKEYFAELTYNAAAHEC